jgi:hypothetical protein
VRRGRTDAALDAASLRLPGAFRWTASTRSADLHGLQRGGWAKAAAFARRHLHGGARLMAGWHEPQGTSVTATGRLRSVVAFWWRRLFRA